MKYSKQDYPLQKESYQIIGICMEVHRVLGKGLLGIVYNDAIKYELKKNNIIICESVAMIMTHFISLKTNKFYI